MRQQCLCKYFGGTARLKLLINHIKSRKTPHLYLMYLVMVMQKRENVRAHVCVCVCLIISVTGRK